MTTDQAIRSIENHIAAHKIGEYPHIFLGEALNMAIAALRAKPPKLDRSRWDGCQLCGKAFALSGSAFIHYDENPVSCEGFTFRKFDFCPCCGKPLTEKAWADLARRIGGTDEN